MGQNETTIVITIIICITLVVLGYIGKNGN